MEHLSARVRYLSPEWRGRSDRPRICSRETRRANTRFYDVDIEDARERAERGELDLETNGFVLMRHDTQVADFGDPAQIQRIYHPEIKALVQELTGADRVALLQHVIRREDAGAFNAAYARYVHCDYSRDSAQDLSRRLMVQGGLCRPDELDRFDYAWINTWQPIENEVQRNPLTLIDTRTLEPGDFVEYLFQETGSEGRASVPFYSPNHRLCYFPRMQTSELIVFKQFDTRSRGSRCAHTSFDDPTAPEDALRRRSIEVRTMCVFAR